MCVYMHTKPRQISVYNVPGNSRGEVRRRFVCSKIKRKEDEQMQKYSTRTRDFFVCCCFFSFFFTFFICGRRNLRAWWRGSGWKKSTWRFMNSWIFRWFSLAAQQKLYFISDCTQILALVYQGIFFFFRVCFLYQVKVFFFFKITSLQRIFDEGEVLYLYIGEVELIRGGTSACSIWSLDTSNVKLHLKFW